jgi:soluble lytic murein transglycosylase-like protein
VIEHMNKPSIYLFLWFFISTLYCGIAHADLYTIEEDGVITITTEYRKGSKVIATDGRKNNRRTRLKNKRKSKQKSSRRRSNQNKKRDYGQGLKGLPKRALKFKNFVNEASNYYDLPPELIWGVMYVESSFKPTAKSDKGALGLMQLMPFTAKDMGVDDPFDPEQNIFGGARLLRILANRFNGDLVLTLSAYHAGGGAVSQKKGIPYKKTAEYVRSTLNAYYRYMDHPPYSP